MTSIFHHKLTLKKHSNSSPPRILRIVSSSTSSSSSSPTRCNEKQSNDHNNVDTESTNQNHSHTTQPQTPPIKDQSQMSHLFHVTASTIEKIDLIIQSYSISVRPRCTPHIDKIYADITSPNPIHQTSPLKLPLALADTVYKKGPLRGLRNKGNTCYVASILQLIYAAHVISHYRFLTRREKTHYDDNDDDALLMRTLELMEGNMRTAENEEDEMRRWERFVVYFYATFREFLSGHQYDSSVRYFSFILL